MIGNDRFMIEDGRMMSVYFFEKNIKKDHLYNKTTIYNIKQQDNYTYIIFFAFLCPLDY